MTDHFAEIKSFLLLEFHLRSNLSIQFLEELTKLQRSILQVDIDLTYIEEHISSTNLFNQFCVLFFNISGTIDSINEKLNASNDKALWILMFYSNFAEFAAFAKEIICHKKSVVATNIFKYYKDVAWKQLILSLYYKEEIFSKILEKTMINIEILIKQKEFQLSSEKIKEIYYKYKLSEEYEFENLYADLIKIKK
ncbi:MAG: hypothetical protein WCK02_02530 [Bacteroidota bacterium]